LAGRQKEFLIGEKESPQTDPVSADEVTKAPSADCKEVDKAFAELKKGRSHRVSRRQKGGVCNKIIV
jgi:hypothetical protein